MRSRTVLIVAVFFAAAVVLASVTSAIEPEPSISDGDISLDSETSLIDPAGPPADLMSAELMKSDLDAHSLDVYEAEDQAEPSKVEEVPEPATVVSLAGLAAMAGSMLLLRLRWFRRR